MMVSSDYYESALYSYSCAELLTLQNLESDYSHYRLMRKDGRRLDRFNPTKGGKGLLVTLNHLSSPGGPTSWTGTISYLDQGNVWTKHCAKFGPQGRWDPVDQMKESGLKGTHLQKCPRLTLSLTQHPHWHQLTTLFGGKGKVTKQIISDCRHFVSSS